MECWQQGHMEELVQEQGDCLFRFCCNISGNIFDAEDLFQDTFLKAMEKADCLLTVENPQSYLVGIAIRLDKNRRRKAAQTAIGGICPCLFMERGCYAEKAVRIHIGLHGFFI